MKISGENKPKVTVLWLDDKRDPLVYLKKKITKDTGTFHNTATFFKDFMAKYDPEFVWVKNYDEFVKYIETHDMPFLISFDYDLDPGTKKGRYCVEWLLKYCRDNNIKLPKTFVHSTNPVGRPKMQDLLGIEREYKPVTITNEDIRRMVNEVINNLGAVKNFTRKPRQNKSAENTTSQEKQSIYRDDDKLELVKDPKVIDGGNFPIKRNKRKFWVSRSNAVILYVFCRDKSGEWCVLASLRGPSGYWSGRWNVINGYLDFGLSLEDTAVKECYEETGVEIDASLLKYVETQSKPDSKNQDVNMVYYAVLSGTTSQYPTDTSHCEKGEVERACWVPMSKIRGIGRWLAGQGGYAIKILKEKILNSNNEIMSFLMRKVESGDLDKIIYDKIAELMKANKSVNELDIKNIVKNVLEESIKEKKDDEYWKEYARTMNDLPKSYEYEEENWNNPMGTIIPLVNRALDSLSELKEFLETDEDVLDNKKKYSKITKKVGEIHKLLDNIWD